MRVVTGGGISIEGQDGEGKEGGREWGEGEGE